MSIPASDNVPDLVLAGPILRRVEARRVVLWLATSRPLRARIVLHPDGSSEIRPVDTTERTHCRSLRAGEHLHYLLLDFALEANLPASRWIGYALELAPAADEAAPWLGWQDWAAGPVLPGARAPRLRVRAARRRAAARLLPQAAPRRRRRPGAR